MNRELQETWRVGGKAQSWREQQMPRRAAAVAATEAAAQVARPSRRYAEAHRCCQAANHAPAIPLLRPRCCGPVDGGPTFENIKKSMRIALSTSNGGKNCHREGERSQFAIPPQGKANTSRWRLPVPEVADSSCDICTDAALSLASLLGDSGLARLRLSLEQAQAHHPASCFVRRCSAAGAGAMPAGIAPASPR